ncbi:MAG: putative ABC transporter permease [Sphaerochaetaceae bacterium]
MNGESIPNLVVYMFAYSVIGYVCETAYCSFGKKRFVDRGFLQGPYLPVYGLGALAVITLLDSIAHRPVLVFVLGALICSIVEFVTGWLLQIIFHARLWDYSKHRFNLYGRVCLLNTTLFGLLALIAVTFIHPALRAILQNVSEQVLGYAAAGILIVFSIDTSISVHKMVSFNTLLSRAKQLKSEMEERIDRLGEELRPLARSYVEREFERLRLQLRNAGKRILDAFPNFSRIDFEAQLSQVRASLNQWREQKKVSRKKKKRTEEQ